MVQFQKSILIIAATSVGLPSTQSFLEAKGWSVAIKTDLKEALNFLMNEQPEVVLVCMDHPNRNVALLPTLILERIRCCVIATCQKSTVANHLLLQKVQCEFKLFPPSAGPAIERVFRKYIEKVKTLTEVHGIFDRKQSHDKPSSVLDYSDWNSKAKLHARPEFIDRVPSDHLLVRGTERMIGEIIESEKANSSKSQGGHSLQKVTQITCLQIECPQFQGYLVAAMGGNCHLDENLQSVIQKHLVQFLKSQGALSASVETFNMTIKPVAFLDWAADYADFLRQSILNDNDLAFAFFPLDGVTTNYQRSATEGMVSIPIGDLFSDTAVGFGLHLFLPTNKKYVLYTPKGSVFYAHQKERLVRRGIEHLHIYATDLGELNRYRAQKYFNTIVDEYHSTADLPA